MPFVDRLSKSVCSSRLPRMCVRPRRDPRHARAPSASDQRWQDPRRSPRERRLPCFARCFRPIASIGALSLLFASASGAQSVPDGYGDPVGFLPAGANSVRTVPAGLVFFNGTDLQLTGVSTPLLSFSTFTFGSFTLALGSTRVLFGESSTGDVWTVPVDPAQPAQQIGNVPFNYDAVLLDDDRALISAKTGGFSTPDNDVILLDLITGQTQPVAKFVGASGPIALDEDGDVYYANASLVFPQPPGATTIYRLPRNDVEAAISAGTVLTEADAEIVISGLDAASDLEFDDDGDLFLHRLPQRGRGPDRRRRWDRTRASARPWSTTRPPATAASRCSSCPAPRQQPTCSSRSSLSAARSACTRATSSACPSCAL